MRHLFEQQRELAGASTTREGEETRGADAKGPGPEDRDPAEGTDTGEGGARERETAEGTDTGEGGTLKGTPPGEDTVWTGLTHPPDTGRPRGGELVRVTCPYCSSPFHTPAPRVRGKVSCPMCEDEFTINSRGELVARKAPGGLPAGLARIVGADAIRGYREMVAESIEGIRIVEDRDEFGRRMRNRSGKAGVLLMVVAVLGLLFSGYLLVSIPGAREDAPSGTAALTGNVMSDMELVPNANVSITNLGIWTTTNSEGGFVLEGVEPGDHTMEVTAPGKGTLVLRFTIGSRETKQGNRDMGGLQIPDDGLREQDLRDDRPQRVGLVLGLQSAFIFMVSLLAFMGGLLAIQGKRFHTTLFLAALSIVSIGFFIGMALALAAVVFIMLGRGEFTS